MGVLAYQSWILDFGLGIKDHNRKSKIGNLKLNHSCGTAPALHWIFPTAVQFTGSPGILT